MDISDKYILVNKIPVQVEDLQEWGQWMEGGIDQRQVAYTEYGEFIQISTVFLGLDHNFGNNSSGPILFETMVFGSALSGEEQRYKTWDEAVKGHEEMCQKVFLTLQGFENNHHE